MRQVAVLSGKGGTGKTSLTAAMVRLAGRCVAVDADVDAANLALLLPGEDGEWVEFTAGRRARVDGSACTRCMRCIDECPFRAMSMDSSWVPVADPLACEGCGVCALWCSAGAIRFDDHQAGAWTVRRTEWGPLVHAALGVGEDNSGKLVAKVRKEATRVASEEGIDLVLIDGPPGIGCPVHATLGGVDLAIAVTEPGVAAAHDLGRLLDLARWFRVPAAVVVNKADLHPQATADIRAIAEARGAPVLASLPFLAEVPRALAKGRCLSDIAALRPMLEACLADVSRMLAGPSADGGCHADT